MAQARRFETEKRATTFIAASRFSVGPTIFLNSPLSRSEYPMKDPQPFASSTSSPTQDFAFASPLKLPYRQISFAKHKRFASLLPTLDPAFSLNRSLLEKSIEKIAAIFATQT